MTNSLLPHLHNPYPYFWLVKANTIISKENLIDVKMSSLPLPINFLFREGLSMHTYDTVSRQVKAMQLMKLCLYPTVCEKKLSGVTFAIRKAIPFI